MIIFHSCISILSYIEGNIWTKQAINYLMSPWAATRGVEISDLIGMCLLNDLRKLSKSVCIGLYRDEGLIVTNRSYNEQECISINL